MALKTRELESFLCAAQWLLEKSSYYLISFLFVSLICVPKPFEISLGRLLGLRLFIFQPVKSEIAYLLLL